MRKRVSDLQSISYKGYSDAGSPARDGLGDTGLGGRGALLTSALAAGPHVPAAVFDVDPAVHVALRLVMVVNQAAVQVEDEPVSLPAAQDGAWRDGEEVKDPTEPGGIRSRDPTPSPKFAAGSHRPLQESLHPPGRPCLA